MKPLSLLALLFLAAHSGVLALPGHDISERQAECIDTRLCPGVAKSCSGSRTDDDQCGGKKLQKQHSFHNW